MTSVRWYVRSEQLQVQLGMWKAWLWEEGYLQGGGEERWRMKWDNTLRNDGVVDEIRGWEMNVDVFISLRRGISMPRGFLHLMERAGIYPMLHVATEQNITSTNMTYNE